MNYNETLNYLDSLQMHKIKLGLDAMQNFLCKVGSPEKKCKYVHVAGTNGKGSVCAALSEILIRSNYRIGVYTSPHLSSPRERFRINNNYISKKDFARLGSTISERLGNKKITYFEFLTALSFLWFSENKIDLVLLETGMGGRLDATNVVTPILSIITSISMDHKEYLGENLKKIAAEKAGIIKPKIPVISGVCSAINNPEDNAEKIITASAQKNNCPFFRLHQEFDYKETKGVEKKWIWLSHSSALSGDIENLNNMYFNPARKKNDSLAIAALQLLKTHGFDISNDSIRQGLDKVRWAGRMEIFSHNNENKDINFILDGAHNEEGISNLAASITQNFPHGQYCGKRIAVAGFMEDKNIVAMIMPLSKIFDIIIVTKPSGTRSADPQKILDFLPEKVRPQSIAIENPQTALQKAQDIASAHDLIVVCGSLYLVGEIRPILCGHLAQ